MYWESKYTKGVIKTVVQDLHGGRKTTLTEPSDSVIIKLDKKFSLHY